jgi:hypothetical protein
MTNAAQAPTVDLKLEIAVIPVSDVDRAKEFYTRLGWRLDADFAAGDDWRVIQFTPPGSPASVIFGKNVTAAAPGSAQGLYRSSPTSRPPATSCAAAAPRSAKSFILSVTCTAVPTNPICPDETGSAARIRTVAAIAPTPRSGIPMATAGCSRKSPRDCPDAWMRTKRRSLRRRTLPARSGERRPRMASMRSGMAASTTRTGPTGTPNTLSGNRPASRCQFEPRHPSSRMDSPTHI